MTYLIGLITSIILWLYTLSTIIKSKRTTFIRVVFILVIVLFPFMGVLYPIYFVALKYLKNDTAPTI